MIPKCVWSCNILLICILTAHALAALSEDTVKCLGFLLSAKRDSLLTSAESFQKSFPVSRWLCVLCQWKWVVPNVKHSVQQGRLGILLRSVIWKLFYYVQRTKGEPPKKLCLCGASPLGLSAMYKNLTGGDHTQVVKIKSAGIRFRFRTQQINEHLCIVCMSADTQGYNDCLFIQKKSKKHNWSSHIKNR